MSQKTSSDRLPSLDGIRAVSILMVMIGHAKYTFPAWAHGSARAWEILGLGSRGVSVFFLVSGFIITTLLLRETEKRGSISLGDFYWRRLFRIVPPFYTFLVIMAVCWAFGWIGLGWRSLLTSALFIRDYINPPDWWTGHSWSLSVEEQFYLLWPCALAIFGSKAMKKTALRLILLAPALRLLTALLWPHAPGPIGLMFHSRMDGLMCGCVLAILRGDPEFVARSRRWLRWQFALIAALVMFIGSTALFWRFGDMYWMAVGFSLENLCIAYLLLYTLENPASAAGRVLNWRPLVHVGQISYSLYLWQQVFLTVLSTSLLGVFPLNVFAALGAAELSWQLIEKPSLRLRDRWRRRRTPQPALAATSARAA